MADEYPPARRDAGTGELHHRLYIEDPYRWLEDPSSVETRAWLEGQDSLWERTKAALPDRAGLEDEFRSRMPGLVGPPSRKGGRIFYSRRLQTEEHPVVMMREPNGDERVLLDPATIDPSGLTTLQGSSVSPDGKRLAYFTANAGNEMSTLHVVDIDTGDALDDPIAIGRGGTIAWFPDGASFAYVRRLGDADLPDEPEAEQFHRRVYLHTVGTDAATDRLLFGEGRNKGTYYGVSVNKDATWMTISASVGTDPRNDLFIVDLADPALTPRTVIESVDASTHGGVSSRDGMLYLSTDLDAPKGRIVRVDPRNPTLPGWVDVVGESDLPLVDFTMTDTRIVTVHSRDVVSEVTVRSRADGSVQATVALPGAGSASVSSFIDGEEVFVRYADATTPGTVFELDESTNGLTVWAEPPGMPDTSDFRCTQIMVESTDGRSVPVFITHRADVDLNGDNPTILYGYGGFNNAMAPTYSSTIATWVKAGGVHVIAGLRGGSEYGEEWHRQGMLANKQQVFDDLYAVAEGLVEQGWTSRERLCVEGGSNGGLLTGVAATQRPDLFGTVVCSAPLLDMLRYDNFGLGRTWVGEYGRPEVPTEFGWLLRYSPVHNVREGSEYPAMLFTVFDNDTRVDPNHARKLCAALQWATALDPDTAPILFRREANVGHSDRSVSLSLGLAADRIAWQASRLGLDLGRARVMTPPAPAITVDSDSDLGV